MSTYVQFLVFVHTAISLVALGLGVPMVASLLGVGGRLSHRWTDWFLVTAIATSVTGFFFPFTTMTPAMITGALALAILALVLVARYHRHYSGHWRWIYAAGMIASVYLIAFVGVVQAFLKVSFLNALAPTGSELPFVLAQAGTLIAFGALGTIAAVKFKAVVEDAVAGNRSGL